MALLLLTACGSEPPVAQKISGAVQEAIVRTLDQRGKALLERNRPRFMKTVMRRDARFAATQRTYFANLGQLPVQTVGFDLDEATLSGESDRYWGEVLVTFQLRGYDARPVVTRDRFEFRRVRDGDAFVVSSTTDESWENDRAVAQQPWDLGPIVVRELSGVLGIFDKVSVVHAPEVMEAAERGRYDVTTVVPDVGVADVVVYAPSESSYLGRLRGAAVADPDRLDAATFPVMANSEKSPTSVASYRVVLNPRVLTGAAPLLDRLMRHELTHVALGSTGRDAPLWMTEGVAEYVSVQATPPGQRRLPTATVALARSGISDLPDDRLFGGVDAQAWYGVAWWICEYIARSYGEVTLWSLLEELAGDADQTQVIADLLGMTTSDLVRNSMRLLLRRYDSAS